MTKQCTKCGETKDESEFYKHKNPCKICKMCHINYRKKYRQQNKEKINEYNRNYYQENKEEVKELHSNYYQQNKEKIKDRIQRNKTNRCKNDPVFRLRCYLGAQISNLHKRAKCGKKRDGNKYHKTLCCTRNEFIDWLYNHASNGFTEADNPQIDHVVPRSWADTEEELYALNHFSNIQLLSKEENDKKNTNPPQHHNFQRVLDNHPNPQLIQEIYDRNVGKFE